DVEDVLVVVPPWEIGAVRPRPGRVAVQGREEHQREGEHLVPGARVEEGDPGREPALVLRAQRQPFEEGQELHGRQRRAERYRERGQEEKCELAAAGALPP